MSTYMIPSFEDILVIIIRPFFFDIELFLEIWETVFKVISCRLLFSIFMLVLFELRDSPWQSGVFPFQAFEFTLGPLPESG